MKCLNKEGRVRRLCNCSCLQHCCRCVRKYADRNPRTFSVLMGIVVPLLLLDVLSIALGFWLATIESPVEIESNDALLEAHEYRKFFGEVFANITALAPQICFRFFLEEKADYYVEAYVGAFADLFVLEETTARMEAAEKFEDVYLPDTEEGQAALNETFLSGDDTLEVNITELYLFMNHCGDTFRNSTLRIMEAIQQRNLFEGAPDLTFGWNRCTPFKRRNITFFEESLRPPHQQDYYTETWNNDRHEYYDYYFDIYRNQQNLSYGIARGKAFETSVGLASGKSACVANTFSGAWFWFTIMSTVGYGNIAAERTESRAMIYTLGLFSILCFGAFLVTAGYIITTIFDDLFVRFKLHVLTRPWLGSIFWATLYFGWMAILMVFYDKWNEIRLGEASSVSYRDSYWFAYISTTTVGFGDFVLLPDVLLMEDIILWPLSFLFGFVFFAAFVGKLSELIHSPFRNQGTGLAARLKRGHTTEPSDSMLHDSQEIASVSALGDGPPKGGHDSDDASGNVLGESSFAPPIESIAVVAAKEPRDDVDGSAMFSAKQSVTTGSGSVMSVKLESMASGYVS